jgi:hypothetical protein
VEGVSGEAVPAAEAARDLEAGVVGGRVELLALDQVGRKLEAYERFVNMSAIAMGILQILAIRSAGEIWRRFPLWLRTLPKHGSPSENVVRLTLQHEGHRISLRSSPRLLLAKCLAKRQCVAEWRDHPMKLAA